MELSSTLLYVLSLLLNGRLETCSFAYALLGLLAELSSILLHVLSLLSNVRLELVVVLLF